MTYNYSTYFNINELDELKSYLKSNNEKIIYTDHFTKYSVDIIDCYPDPLRTKRIYGSDFNINELKQGDWILYKFEHINELKEQGHKFPDFTSLQSNKYLKIFESGGFILYEKVSG